ncbi:hypothetical protein BHE74_00048003, partial [Ensete ventricosum]
SACGRPSPWAGTVAPTGRSCYPRASAIIAREWLPMLQATTTFARSPASRDYLAHRRSPLRAGTDLPIGGSPVGALSRKRSTRGAVPVSARPCRRPARM